MARYIVYITHEADVVGVGPTRLLGGTFIDDAAWSVAALLAAGFILLPVVDTGGAPTDFLSRNGLWTAPSSAPTPAIMHPPWAAFTNITSNVSIGSTLCPAWYFGRAPKALTTLDVRTKIVTVMTGTTWCELAVAKGPAPIPATGASLTVVGYYSTGASGAPFNSTNPSTVTIPVSGGQSIDLGDHLWLVFAKLSTGSPAFRAGGAANELNTGHYVDAGNVRPSTILGTPTAFAIGATTTNLPVFYVYI